MKRLFTVNPAYPHPDQDPDSLPPWPLSEAIAYAIKTLQDPNASQHARNFAADQLGQAAHTDED